MTDHGNDSHSPGEDHNHSPDAGMHQMTVSEHIQTEIKPLPFIIVIRWGGGKYCRMTSLVFFNLFFTLIFSPLLLTVLTTAKSIAFLFIGFFLGIPSLSST